MHSNNGIDLSNWLTDDQVCAQLGISVRTLTRKCGVELHPRKRPVSGKVPERVFDPAEVKNLMPPPPQTVIRSTRPTVAEMAESATPGLPALPGFAGPDAQLAMIAELIQIAAAAQNPRPWITLDEASEASGLSRGFLRRMIRRGVLKGVRDVSIKVHRQDLDDLDVSSALVPANPPKPKKGVRDAKPRGN